MQRKFKVTDTTFHDALFNLMAVASNYIFSVDGDCMVSSELVLREAETVSLSKTSLRGERKQKFPTNKFS